MMTKTEAYAYIKRAREGLRDAEQALAANDGDALNNALDEVAGSAGSIQAAGDTYGEGLRNIWSVGEFHREA